MRRFAPGLVLFVLAAPAAVAAEGISSQQADAILQELRNIRALLERGAPPPSQAQAPAPDAPVEMRLGNAPVLGKSDAPVTMLEFTDLECPFCRQFHTASFDEIKRKYIDTGKVRYVSRDFPLPFHPQAHPAAKVARCAGEQGRFWEMRHALIANPLNPETMARLSKDMNLDVKRMMECIADPRIEKAIQADIAEANALGVSGTPTFVIGRSKGDSLEGTRVVGAQPLATFEGRIDALLASPQ
jgi:protein-disulfide isomerase